MQQLDEETQVPSIEVDNILEVDNHSKYKKCYRSTQ